MWLIFVPVCQVQASRGRESILGTVEDLGPRKELGFLSETLGREDSSANVLAKSRGACLRGMGWEWE